MQVVGEDVKSIFACLCMILYLHIHIHLMQAYLIYPMHHQNSV
jgi:hypothetical protein